MQYSVYHMSPQSHLIRELCTKMSIFRHNETRRRYGPHHI